LAKFIWDWRGGLQTHKKERGQYPAILTEQAWSIKDLLNGFQGIFFNVAHSG